MLKRHTVSTNKYVKSIADDFENFDKIAPHFVIFETKEEGKCNYMHTFKALQISKNTSLEISSHEFGHAILGVTSNTKVPDDYENVIVRAKKYALSPENKEFFKSYIQSLSKDGENSRTEGEKGAVSDIISSIFQQPGFRIGNFENVCMLPSCHSRDYYFDEEKNEMNVKRIFDEDFANFYSLKANNCEQEVETLRKLFGDEFIQVLDEELIKSAQKLEKVVDREDNGMQLSTLDNIKATITGERQGEIALIREETVKENEKQEKEI